MSRRLLAPFVRGRHLRRRPCTLLVERVEDRLLLAVITVNTTADDTIPDSTLSLREAIEVSNGTLAFSALSPAEQAQVDTTSSPNLNVIDFNIPTTDPGYNPATGVWTITPATTSLPTITQPVTIDGYSPSTAHKNTLVNGDDATLVIQIDGANNSSLGDGLAIDTSTAGGTTVQGLVLSRFPFNGINVFGTGSGVTIAGNFIGTDPTGTSTNYGNGNNGVQVSLSPTNVVVGGITPDARNLISGNSSGVLISKASGNTVEGNFIGTDHTGLVAIPNINNGVSLGQGATNNTIGGTTLAARNVISGNATNGVSLSGQGPALPVSGNVIAGNYIGVDVNGTAALANGTASNSGDGVLISGASGNTVGGTTTGAGNTISGNGNFGVDLSGDGNLVQGNLIGTDASGTKPLGNGSAGVFLGSLNNLIGGTASPTSMPRNIISGNTREGIFISAGTSQAPGNNLVQGNYIGTDITGTLPLGNGLSGITLLDSSGNTIGGTTTAAGNVISANGGGTQPGISISRGISASGSQDNMIENNLIGTDANDSGATTNLGNSFGIVDTDSSNNMIGVPGSGNIISYNSIGGIFIFSSAGTAAIGNSISSNTITFNKSDGVRVLAGVSHANLMTSISSNAIGHNQANGISLFNSDGNSVRQNTVSGNSQDGVRVDNGVSNSILSNSIFSDGDLEIALNNANNGQPAPVLTTATSSGGSTTIQGRLQAAPNATYLIQFFSSPASNPPGFGEGMTLIGQASSVTTDSSGLGVIDVTLPVSVAADQFLTATATNEATNDTSQFSKTSPNLSVVVAAAPEPVLQTTDLTYAITVVNGGASPTPGVTLIDTLPAGVTFVSATGGVTPVGNILTFPIGTILRGATQTFTIVVRADTVGKISDTATLTTSTDARNPDLNPADNTSTVASTVLPVADLAVTNSADLATVPQFEDLTYTVSVKNNGPSPAVGVSLTDTLPAGAIFVSATGGVTTVGDTLTFPVGTLAVGASASYTIVVQLSITGTNLDTASASSATADLNPSNNTATVSTNALLTFAVKNTNDSGPNSLRQAILNADSDTTNPQADAITFHIPGPGPYIIRLASVLPQITHPVIIDATPAGVFTGTDAVVIDGSSIGGSTPVATTQPLDQPPAFPGLLDVESQGVVIRGLTIRGSEGFGIVLGAQGGNTLLAGNNIGTSPDAVVADTPNIVGGVLVLSAGNTIGGVNSQDSNVIAGGGYGVYFFGAGATNNTVIGNFIGTDRAGNILGAPALKVDGIEGDGGSKNTIGQMGAGNLIAGYQAGIYLFGNSTGYFIQANTINNNGINPTGNTMIENGGILLTATSGNLIGGTTAALGNTISNNRGSGVVIFAGATGNTLSFNKINANGDTGVYLFNAPGNIVGTIGAGNTVSRNGASGIDLEGSMTTNTLVQSNTITLNGADGVYIFDAPGNTIGGATAGAGNQIKANAFSGVEIDGPGSTRDVVQGNTITNHANGYGVVLEDGATQDTIGGGGGAANTFQGNNPLFGDIKVLANGLPIPGNPSGGNQLNGNIFLAGTGQTLMAAAQGKHRFRRHGRTHVKGALAGHTHPSGPRHFSKKDVHHRSLK